MTGLSARQASAWTGLSARRASAWTTSALLCVVLGAAIASNVQVGFVLVVVLLGASAVSAPAGCWVFMALVAALTFRGGVTLGALPSIATFIDIPLAWGALAVSLLRNRGKRAAAGPHGGWLIALALAVVTAWAFHPTEVVRPLLYLALLGEPFAILFALLLDPPSPRLARLLLSGAIGLGIVQLPLGLWQFARTGLGDGVQGTLYGAGAGAHVASAVAVVAGTWLLMAQNRGRSSPSRMALGGSLFLIPFLADAKQVLFAFPMLVLVGGWSLRRRFVACAVAAVAVLAAVILLLPTGPVALDFLENARAGQGGKQATAELIWSEVATDPESIAFGKGPAETVSRAAFMTTDGFLRPDSSLRILELRPATTALEAQANASNVSGAHTSFDSGVSSALGVLGDLGLFGAAAYVGLLVSIVMALRRNGTPESRVLAGGWAMFGLLGLVFDWWEQPPLSVFLAVLTGLVLTGGLKQFHGAEGSSDSAAVPVQPGRGPSEQW